MRRVTRLRFRWTRARYRKAASLARYFARHVYELPSDPPALVQRYFELWERHPRRDDPLLTPFRYRACFAGLTDDIPF